jgi:hypothetical protein
LAYTHVQACIIEAALLICSVCRRGFSTLVLLLLDRLGFALCEQIVGELIATHVISNSSAVHGHPNILAMVLDLDGVYVLIIRVPFGCDSLEVGDWPGNVEVLLSCS